MSRHNAKLIDFKNGINFHSSNQNITFINCIMKSVFSWHGLFTNQLTLGMGLITIHQYQFYEHQFMFGTKSILVKLF